MGDRDEVADVSMPFLAPHYVLSHLFHNCRARFDSLLLGEDADATTLPKFWSTVVTRKDPRIIRHPMCKKKDWQHLMIPIMLHGDAVPAVGVGKSHSKSFDTYSWQSLFAQGSSILVKVYIFGLFEDCKTKPVPKNSPGSTMHKCWKILI